MTQGSADPLTLPPHACPHAKLRPTTLPSPHAVPTQLLTTHSCALCHTPARAVRHVYSPLAASPVKLNASSARLLLSSELLFDPLTLEVHWGLRSQGRLVASGSLGEHVRVPPRGRVEVTVRYPADAAAAISRDTTYEHHLDVRLVDTRPLHASLLAASTDSTLRRDW